MNQTITNDNLYLLLPGKVAWVATIYTEEHHVNPLDALRIFYHSNTYKELEKEETKLWHYGPVALYEEFLEKQ
ncbi:hypothetical protein [Bacteroides sp. UBA939]|uniref:hypothetical protein n=1 Tax=Bacteroides sp. UBA939 TaxID=1946092 RepID=UPI0025C64B57|nr:hypothetical protein [Bacteroides sp. UBA939]